MPGGAVAAVCPVDVMVMEGDEARFGPLAAMLPRRVAKVSRAI